MQVSDGELAREGSYRAGHKVKLAPGRIEKGGSATNRAIVNQVTAFQQQVAGSPRLRKGARRRKHGGPEDEGSSEGASPRPRPGLTVPNKANGALSALSAQPSYLRKNQNRK